MTGYKLSYYLVVIYVLLVLILGLLLWQQLEMEWK
jgi:hypothetical protein